MKVVIAIDSFKRHLNSTRRVPSYIIYTYNNSTTPMKILGKIEHSTLFLEHLHTNFISELCKQKQKRPPNED